MSDEMISARSAQEQPGGNILYDAIVKVLKGIVHSQHVGLTHTTVRIRVGRRFDLRVRLTIDDPRCFVPGQAVIAMIPAEAVRLEAGLFRRSRQRLNRWYGRIVLVRPKGDGQLITAKVHGEDWSLASTVPILETAYPARTWDPVNIVVDPHAIELVPSQGGARLEPEVLIQSRLVFQ